MVGTSGGRPAHYICTVKCRYLFRKKSKPAHHRRHYCYEGSRLLHLQSHLASHRPFAAPPRPPQWCSIPFAAADRQLANLEGTGGPISSHGMKMK